MAGSGCNAYQIRKIYAIGGALGMVKRNEEDDLLHELVEGMTGKKSIKALTYGEACKVIGELEGRQGTPPPRKSGKPLRKTAPGHTSEGQRRKVWALMYRLQDASPSKAPLGDRLCAIIKKELGISQDNKAWAKTIPMPEDSDASRHCAYLVVDGVNPGLTDLFTRQARKIMQEQQKSSVLQKLKQEPPAHKSAAPKKREPER